MGWGLCTSFSPYTSPAYGVELSRDRSDIVKGYILCASFLFLSFTASDGSDGTTAGRVVSLRSIMVHRGFISKEVRCARKRYIVCAKQHHTPHCWLPAKVMYLTSSTERFFLLTCSTQIFIVREHSNTSTIIFSLENNGFRHRDEWLLCHPFHCTKYHSVVHPSSKVDVS